MSEINSFMNTILQHYSGTVQSSLQQATTTNTRNISSLQGITSSLNEKDLSAVSGKLGNLFPDAAEMAAAIEYGNKLLTVSRQLEAIKQKTGANDKAALRIRKEMGDIVSKHASDEEKKVEKKLKYNQKLLDSAKKEIELRKNMTKDARESQGISEKQYKDELKHFDTIKKEKEESIRKLKVDKERYSTIQKNHAIEQNALKIIDKQLVSARNMVKAQLAVNVARGKMSMKEAAVGIYKTGGSVGDMASVALKSAQIKAFGETAFKMMQKGKDIRTGTGSSSGNASRPLLGVGVQVSAAIVGAGHVFLSVVTKAAVFFSKVVEGAINFLKKGFSGGIEGLMQGLVDIIASLAQMASGVLSGLLGWIPGLEEMFKGMGEAASKIISSFGGLLVQVRMFELRQSELHAQEKWAVYGRTGDFEDKRWVKDKNGRKYQTREIDNRGLPPNLMIPWVTSLAQQGIRNHNQRNKLMDMGVTLGMDAGETASNFGAIRDASTSTTNAVKNMDIAFKSAKDSANKTKLAVTIFTSAIEKAAVAARYMQVDLKQVAGLSNKLTSKEGGFSAFGLNLNTDLEDILQKVSTVGKDWSDSQRAYAGQYIYNGKYKGNVLGGMYAATLGDKSEELLTKEGFEGLYNAKKGTNFKSDLNKQLLFTAAMTAAKASEGTTGEARNKIQEETYKSFGIKDMILMGMGNDAYNKSKNKTSEEFAQNLSTDAIKTLDKSQQSATDILKETNKVEILQYQIQTKIAGMVKLLFAYLNEKDEGKKSKLVNQLGVDFKSLFKLAGGELLGKDGKAVLDGLFQDEKEQEKTIIQQAESFKTGGAGHTFKHSGGNIKFHSGGVMPSITALAGEEFNIHSAGIKSGATTMEVKSRTQVGRDKLEDKMNSSGKNVVINFTGPIYNRSTLEAVLSDMGRYI